LVSKKRKSGKENRAVYAAALSLILLLGAGLTLGFFYGITPLNLSDNYLYGEWAHHISVVGITGFAGLGADGMKYFVIGGTAILYSLFGASSLTSVLFDLATFLGTIVVVYLIGSELYNRKVGLVSSLLYCAFPLAVLETASGGDDVPMAFFVSLAVLTLLLAMKGRRKAFYALSGFFGVAGFLTVPEALIIVPFLLLLLLADTIMHLDRKQLSLIASFAVGIACAVALIALLGYLTAGDPLYIYHVDSSWYTNYCYNVNCTLSFAPLQTYLGELLPFQVLGGAQQIIANPTAAYLQGAIHASLVNASINWQGYMIGAYFYVAIVSAAYLLLKRDKRVAVPGLWILATLLYLSFGTMSLQHWLPVQPQYQRFTLIFGPAIALLIGFFIIRFTERKGKEKKRKGRLMKAKYVLAVAIVLLLLLPSYYTIRFLGYSQYSYLYPLLRAADFINALPPGTTVLRPNTVPVDEYTNYKANLQYGPYDGCGGISNGTYVVDFANATLEEECNLTVAFGPQARPEWLDPYIPSLYDFFGNFTDITVYYRK
jgi:4-amino-4-deoxy-L-arabinose transferase-like glycosyltransferase